jgi:cobalt-zinc-cadmium efflux system membrane fusion protein
MKTVTIVLLLALTLVGCSGAKPETGKEVATGDSKQVPPIEMGIEAQKQVDLQVAHAEVESLNELIEVTGTVQPIDSQVGHIRPLASGRLQEVFARVGDRVAAGQPLAQLDTIEAGDLGSQYLTAQADLKKIQVQHATALKQLERNRHLVEIGAASQKDLESSQAEEEALQASISAQESLITGLSVRMRRLGVDGENPRTSSMTAIRSPFAGVVIKAAAAPGEVVDPTSELFQVANLSRVWVQADVYEKDIGRIRAGQMASISVDTYPGEKFSGKMTYIGDILDPQTRTVKVRCEVPNPGAKLKLDMFASVGLPTTFTKRALAVPAAAVQQVENDKVVFIQRDSTHFEKRIVQLGKTAGDWVEITSGLKKDDKVVSRGAFFVKSTLLKNQLGGEE